MSLPRALGPPPAPCLPWCLPELAGPAHCTVTRAPSIVLFSFSGTLFFPIPYSLSAFKPLPLLFSVHGLAQSRTRLSDFALFSFLLFSPAVFLLCLFSSPFYPMPALYLLKSKE